MVDSLQKAQDEWRIETRIRTSGKLQGYCYKVYKHPDTGVSYWSLTAAQKAGFTGGEGMDGRRKRRKSPDEAASKKPQN